MTIVGSAIWCYILAYLGDKAFRLRPDLIDNPEAMVAVHQIAVAFGSCSLIVVFAALYFVVMRSACATGSVACFLSGSLMSQMSSAFVSRLPLERSACTLNYSDTSPATNF